MSADPLKVSVSQLLFACEDWELLRRSLRGENVWVNVDGFRKGEFPGSLFHNRLAAPLLRDLREGKHAGVAKAIVGARGDAPAIARALNDALSEHYVPALFAEACRDLTADQIVAMGLGAEQLGLGLAELFAGFPAPKKIADVAAWVLPPEKLHAADFGLPDGAPLRVTGKFDAALFDPGRSSIVVIDFKCKTVCKPTTDLLQLTLYGWLLFRSTGIPVDGALLYLGTGGGLTRYDRGQLVEVLRSAGTIDFMQRVREEVRAAAAPDEGAQRTAELLDALAKLGCKVTAQGPVVGPRIIRCKVVPVTGKTPVKKIVGVAQDLQIPLKLAVPPFIEASEGYVAVDIPRRAPQPVLLRDVLARAAGKRPSSRVAFPLGVALDGGVFWVDLADASQPSVLVGGTSGSGKTEVLKSAVAAMCLGASPQELQFVLVDPKRVGFSALKGIAHVDTIVHDPDRTMGAVTGMVEDMESRYALFQQHGVESIGQYHRAVGSMPHRVIVIDEYADLMGKQTKKELESLIQRLCQKGRAAGIHLILATQRPDATVVSPLIKANLQVKVALKVGSRTNSMIILDEPGAEALLGKGDMFAGGPMPKIRLQSPLVTRDDLAALGAAGTA